MPRWRRRGTRLPFIQLIEFRPMHEKGSGLPTVTIFKLLVFAQLISWKGVGVRIHHHERARESSKVVKEKDEIAAAGNRQQQCRQEFPRGRPADISPLLCSFFLLLPTPAHLHTCTPAHSMLCVSKRNLLVSRTHGVNWLTVVEYVSCMSGMCPLPPAPAD